MTGIARVIPFIILLLCMLQFVKDALRELRHVVWPTRKETQKFFLLALGLIIAFGVYLFIFSQIFSETLFALKDIFWTGQSNSVPVDFDVSDVFLNEEAIPEESVFADDELSPEIQESIGVVEEDAISPDWEGEQE